MKNTRLWAFFVLIALIVIAFACHIGFNIKPCDDSRDFNLACHKMYMSFGVLFCLGLLLLLSAGLYVLTDPTNEGADHPAKNVFDSFSKQLIPIATLVLGYYFGTSIKDESTRPPNITNVVNNPAATASLPK